MFTPITFEKHGNKAWKPVSDFSFASKDSLAAVSADELPLAMFYLPIVIVKTDDSYRFALMQGVQFNQNLMVNSDGRWIGKYLPNILRAYPFRLAESKQAEKIVCVEERSDVVVDLEDATASGAIPFYNDDKTPSEKLTRVIKFIEKLNQREEKTMRILTVLKDLGLIKHLPKTDLLAETSSEVQKFLGQLLIVDEPKLNSLSGDKLAELRDSGGLVAAYCQILSLKNIRTLLKLHQTNTPNYSIDELFDEDLNDSISFENL